MRKLILSVFALSLSAAASAQQLAFPGAEGFGRFATGGRGGKVYHVTNLNDTGSGSFRDAVSSPNRIVVFDVAGVIRLKSRVVVSKNIYIAGQTAPGEGITLYGNGLSFSGASNTICRYLRVRMGIVGDSGADAVGIANGENIIFDHCSMAWGRDETFSINGASAKNITIQNSIISQGLLGHSAGGLIQTDGGVTIYRTLYMNNDTRNPKFKGRHQYVNNIVYNWKTAAYIMGGDSEGTSYANATGNVFITGPTGKANAFSGANERYNIYANDNVIDDNHDGVLALRDIKESEFGGGPTFQDEPYDYPVLPAVDARSLTDDLLPNVGASLPYRDNLDWMLISDLRTWGLRGEIISDERTLDIGAPDTWNLWTGTKATDTDGDGMPDWWEEANGTNVNEDDAMALQADGYANIEHYINSITSEQSQHFIKAPVALKAAERESESLTLEWRDMTDHETGYVIEQLDAEGEYGEIARTKANVTSKTITGLTPATSYTFRVRAFNGEEYSEYSNVLTVSTRAQAPDITSTDDFQADVIWQGIESAEWNFTDGNWEDENGVSTAYSDGMKVQISGNSDANITIPSPVKPAAVMVNTSADVKLTGEIGGNAQLSKAGSGTLVLDGNNTYTGSTVVWDGILEISSIGNAGAASSIGAAPAWLWNGGTVRYTGNSAKTDRELTILRPSTLDIANEVTLTHNGPILGDGDLIKTGAGTLSIPLGQMNTTGDLYVRGGKVSIQGKDALGTNPHMQGTLHLEGGRFEVKGGDKSAEGIVSMPIVVEGDETSYLHIDQRNFVKGDVSGDGNLVIEVEYLREVYQGNWRNFVGNVTAKQTGTEGNQFYLDNSKYGGLPNCRLDLQGKLEMRSYSNSKTYSIGALTGSSTTTLACCFLKTDGGSVTWRIGGLGTDETFNGKITNGIEHTSRIGLTNIVKDGEGYWRLTGAQKYRGTTRIVAGTLIQNGTHSQDKDYTGTYYTPGQYTVSDGAILAGKGNTMAPVVVLNGGTIAPGDLGIGTFTVKNNVTLQAGGVLEIEVDRAAKTNDKLSVSNTFKTDGILSLKLVGGEYADGDEFTILSAKTYSGEFGAIEPAVPAEGLEWDTSTLYTEGKLRVCASSGSGITHINADSENGVYYDLKGRTVTTPQSSGIYIRKQGNCSEKVTVK